MATSSRGAAACALSLALTGDGARAAMKAGLLGAAAADAERRKDDVARVREAATAERAREAIGDIDGESGDMMDLYVISMIFRRNNSSVCTRGPSTFPARLSSMDWDSEPPLLGYEELEEEEAEAKRSPLPPPAVSWVSASHVGGGAAPPALLVIAASEVAVSLAAAFCEATGALLVGSVTLQVRGPPRGWRRPAL